MSYFVRHLILFLILSVSQGCVRPSTSFVQICPSDYFLVLLVDARHLDYTDNASLLQTIAKHPSDGSKNSDVGHAWIYLHGMIEGQPVFLEGGHSGELGVIQTKYFEGVISYFEAGDSNPIRYLWSCQRDGFFQWGNGDHCPTYAARVDLTPEQFTRILEFVENYPFSQYYLTGNQCSSFVTQVAALVDLHLDDKITQRIEPFLYVDREPLRLWTDPKYSLITISSPDILEGSLIKAVQEGKAVEALDWYLKTHPVPLTKRIYKTIETLKCFPERYHRYRLMRKITTGD